MPSISNPDKTSVRAAAIVLAAGLSTRMGQPKMVLPWGETTVIGQVVQTLADGGVQRVIVVTGAADSAIRSSFGSLPEAVRQRLRVVYNPEYANGEMLTSLQVGLGNLLTSRDDEGCNAFLLALGDQPQMQTETVRAVIAASSPQSKAIIVPSYAMRRGHPWLVSRALWPELIALRLPYTMRDFLNHHRDAIDYIAVPTPSILADLDTPDDYQQQAP